LPRPTREDGRPRSLNGHNLFRGLHCRHYSLHGAEFDKRLYFNVIRSELLIQDIAALANADQRSIALAYLSFERLFLDSDADLIDVGIRGGTRLYRLRCE